MPIYDYRCEGCGGFTARQPLALFDRPVPCPTCGAPSARALSVPAAWAMPRRGNASAAASPGTQEAEGYRRLRHGGGCACCPP